MVRDPSGLALTTTFSYTDCGNVGTMTDPNGAVTSFTVDEEGFVTQIQAPSPLNYKVRFTYDKNRDVVLAETENRDRKGVLDGTTPWIDTVLSYNANRRLVSRRTRIDASTTALTSYEYTPAGRLQKVVKPEGNQQYFEWDERGLLFKATRGYGSSDASTVRVDYDLNGNRSRVTSGRGYATVLESDLQDRVEKITNEVGAYVTYAYDLASNVHTIAKYDPSATLVSSREQYFDEIHRLWKIVDSRFGGGLTGTTYPTTIFTRDRGHLLANRQDPLGNNLAWGYDAARRLLTETNAVSDVTTYGYDANSNVTSVSRTEVPTAGSSETFVTEYDYDEVNRVTERREIDRTDSQNVLHTTYEWDSRGNLAFRTDAANHPTRFAYDLANRLLKRERALSVGQTIDDFVTMITESFAFDLNDRLTTLTDDNFNATGYDFDDLDRVVTTTYADTKSVSQTWDQDDNLSGWTDQNGTVVSNTFDYADRLTSRSVTRGTNVAGTTSESYTYDALDRLLTAADDDYQVENTWDSVGNLMKQRQGYTATGSERWKTVAYDWTSAGSLSAITYPSAFKVSHTRDAIYRMTALVDVPASVNIATFTWQGTNRLATTANQNGTGTDYAYDGFARLASIDHTLSGGGSLHKFEYLYDKVHSRRMEKNTFDATWVASLPTAVQTFLNGRGGKGDVYAYDWADRLVDVRYDVTNPATEVSTPGSQTYAKLVQYTLDGVGNRSQVATTIGGNTTTVTYASDVVNEYTSVGGTNRSHDDNGNVKDDGTHLFIFDYRNHIVEAKDKATGASIATYRCDALGRRVEKALNGGATTRYMLDGVEVVEEYDGNNAWQADYVYEDGIDRPRVMDRADIADVDGDSNTTEVMRFAYHQNALGNVTELSDPSGAVDEWVTYDVYGQPTIRDQQGTVVGQSAVGNPYLYTARERDAESGLFHYRARSYDAAIGMFIQRDPTGYQDGADLYAYARSAPSSWTDPLGLHTFVPTAAPPSGRPGDKEKTEKDNAESKAKIEEAMGRAKELLEWLLTQPGFLDRLHLVHKGLSCELVSSFMSDFFVENGAGPEVWPTPPPGGHNLGATQAPGVNPDHPRGWVRLDMDTSPWMLVMTLLHEFMHWIAQQQPGWEKERRGGEVKADPDPEAPRPGYTDHPAKGDEIGHALEVELRALAGVHQTQEDSPRAVEVLHGRMKADKEAQARSGNK